MKYFPRIFKGLFKNGLAYIFLCACLFMHAVIFDYGKLSKYFTNFGEKGCEPIKKVISFGFNCYGVSDFDPFEFVEGFFRLLSIPSSAVNEILLWDLRLHYSHWCAETFDVVGMLTFPIINVIYWMFWGYLIETIHDYHIKTQPIPKKPFGIFDDNY